MRDLKCIHVSLQMSWWLSKWSRTHEVWRQVESVELVGGLEQVGHEVGHEHLFAQLVRGSSLAAGHLHAPLIGVCDNADGLRDGLIQHRMLHNNNSARINLHFTYTQDFHIFVHLGLSVTLKCCRWAVWDSLFHTRESHGKSNLWWMINSSVWGSYVRL